MTVRVVTDSCADLPDDTARDLGISVVALSIHFGTRTYRDNVTISHDEFYSMLARSPELPTTSQPSPGEFRKVYEELGTDADGIVSIHISSKLSGTGNSAQQAAAVAEVACPIEIIDSGQGSMALGLSVIAAAHAARRGAGPGEVAAVARDAAARSQSITLFDTLELLYRGGRIGKARSLMASILSIKPMVIIRDGIPHPLGKARTFRRGLIALERAAREFAPVQSLAVMHSTTPEVAAAVADNLRDLLPDGEEPYLARFGPVLGVYAGPGAVGIALLQAGK